jgi:hypothetical protein
MSNNEQVLMESPSARNFQLAQIEDRAEEFLNKAKALHFDAWQGTGAATTEQVAEFYEVPLDTVKSVVKYHRSEFDADGLKVLTGKELSSARLNFNLTNKARNLTIWNPRSTLRLGYLLRDSAIAKAVRTTSLDFIEQAAQQTPPKTQAEITLAHSQQLVDQERRLKSVESDVQQMKQIRIDAIEELHQLPPSKEPAPPLTERASLRQLVNKWCDATHVDQQIAWRKLYTELYYRDGFNVNVRMKSGKYAKKIDAIVDCGKMSVLYAIACDIFGNGNGQGGSHA